MAISHCSVRHGRAGKGAAHAQYVQGMGRYGRDDVAHVEHGNMPAFAAADPLAFWQAADAHERANGRAYTEVQFAVPRELTEPKAQIRFAGQMAYGIVGMKHPFTLALHDTLAADGGRNVHVHLMFSERALDGHERGPAHFFKRADKANPARGGARKDRALHAKSFVSDTRQRYEQTVNRTLERLGLKTRISMARNERREPEPKLGPAHPRAGRDERREARLERVRELRAALAEARQIVQEGPALRSEILDLSNDIKAALAERERQAERRQAERQRPVPAPVPSYEERRRALVGDDVPDPRKRLAAMRAAIEADLMRNAPKVLSEDQRRANDAEAVRAQLATAPDRKTRVDAAEPGRSYSGTILLVTDFHVAQNAGREVATLHDKRQLQQSYQVGDKPHIRYGPDGQERVQTATIKPKGLRH